MRLGVLVSLLNALAISNAIGNSLSNVSRYESDSFFSFRMRKPERKGVNASIKYVYA